MYRYVLFACASLQLVLHTIGSQNYRFDIEYANATNPPNDYIKIHSFTFQRINKTTKGANVDLEFLEEMTRDLNFMIKFGFHLWVNNEFKPTPINFEFGVCDAFDKGVFDIPSMFSNASFHKCPFPKGKAYVYNIIPTSKGWPKFIPKGRYKLKLDIYVNKIAVLLMDWIIKIVYDV